MTTKRIGLAGLSGALLVLAAIHACPIAHAEPQDGLGRWEGSGVASEAGGKVLGPFTIVMDRTAPRSGMVRSDGRIKTGDGREIVFWQEVTPGSDGRFRLTSNRGTGGGACFQNDLCQSLEESRDGNAFATTIVKDGPDRVRVLVTELHEGRALRFYAQTLVRRR